MTIDYNKTEKNICKKKRLKKKNYNTQYWRKVEDNEQQQCRNQHLMRILMPDWHCFMRNAYIDYDSFLELLTFFL